jgi:hypothetical protein
MAETVHSAEQGSNRANDAEEMLRLPLWTSVFGLLRVAAAFGAVKDLLIVLPYTGLFSSDPLSGVPRLGDLPSPLLWLYVMALLLGAVTFGADAFLESKDDRRDMVRIVTKLLFYSGLIAMPFFALTWGTAAASLVSGLLLVLAFMLLNPRNWIAYAIVGALTAFLC